MTKLDLSWVHRQAGLACQFTWQDEGEMAELDSTTILGQVPGKEIWIVECDGTATDAVANGEYYWPIEAYLAVYLHDDGTPTSRPATDEEIALFIEEEQEHAS